MLLLSFSRCSSNWLLGWEEKDLFSLPFRLPRSPFSLIFLAAGVWDDGMFWWVFVVSANTRLAGVSIFGVAMAGYHGIEMMASWRGVQWIVKGEVHGARRVI
jgi:hypothetical protein